MFIRLAVKNILSRKSSITIVAFISFAIALLVAANAVFDSTEQGLESSYIHSFTGDFFIRARTDKSVSLFGDDTPLLGKLTKTAPLPHYEELAALLKDEFHVAAVPQISGTGMLETDDGDDAVMTFFGVPGNDYMAMMRSLRIIAGMPYSDETSSLMLSQAQAQKLRVKIGDTVQFIVEDGPVYKIRAAKVTALYEPAVDNPILDRFVLVSPYLARSLIDMEPEEDESRNASAGQTDSAGTDDILSFFADTEDIDVEDSLGDFDEPEPYTAPQEEAAEAEQEAQSWHFLVCLAQNRRTADATIKKLNKYFRQNGMDLQALNWRAAAGSTAIYIYWLRIIFNIGVLVILAAGFIIINNTLVINVLDRTKEIGTLRAIGASRLFISAECMAETILMAFASGIAGSLLGIALAHAIAAMGIPLANTFLVQLFGGTRLTAIITASNIARSLLMTLAIGVLGWIYPIRAALGINPVTAMQGGK